MSNLSEPQTAPSSATGEENTAGLKPFFSTPWGHPTVATEGDLAQTIHEAEKANIDDLVEIDRYWAVYPYSYISICKSKNHGEIRYFVVEPHLTETEKQVFSFIIGEVQSKIRNYDTTILSSDDTHRRAIIREAALELMDYYRNLPDDTIKQIHQDGELSTEDFTVQPDSKIEELLQRMLIGDVEAGEYQSREKTRCRRHAISCGASGSTDYLRLPAPLQGHPELKSFDGSLTREEQDEEDNQDHDVVNETKESEEESGSIIGKLPLLNRLSRDRDGEEGEGYISEDVSEVEEVQSSVESTTEPEVEGESGMWADPPDPQPKQEGSESGEYQRQTENGGVETGEDVRSDGGTQQVEAESDTQPTQPPQSVGEVDFNDKDNFTDDPDYNPTLGLPPASKRFEVVEAGASSEEEHPALTEYQIYKILYYIEREFVGYKRIDPIKNDERVEDISASGYNRPVFVYHEEYQNVRTNVTHDKNELDTFVTSLAQLSGEELSRRNPKTDAKLPDGSRAELTYGLEISEHGSDYVIRQYKEIPHTPIDLINWETYSLKQMALLWLFVQYDRSILIAGETGAGKTTTLNALSLFIPSNAKVNTVEDTQELELPHENWQANTTREAGDLTDDSVSIDMADLIQSALRKRPDRILVGEVRGDEAYNLFQSIRTGHPGITTFHAPTFEKMVRRMTSGKINLSADQITALDLVLLQSEIRVGGDKIRRNKAIYEIEGFAGRAEDSDQNLIERNLITKWDSQTDSQRIMSGSSAQVAKIKELNGWSDTRHEAAIRKRLVVLSGLIVEDVAEYDKVAATIQAAIINPDQVLESIAHGSLTEDVEQFGEDIVNIDVEHDGREENIERPDTPDDVYSRAENIIEASRQNGVLSKYV